MIPQSDLPEPPGKFVQILKKSNEYILRFLGPKLKPTESKFPGAWCGNITGVAFQTFPGSFDQPSLEDTAGEFRKDAETQAFPV